MIKVRPLRENECVLRLVTFFSRFPVVKSVCIHHVGLKSNAIKKHTQSHCRTMWY